MAPVSIIDLCDLPSGAGRDTLHHEQVREFPVYMVLQPARFVKLHRLPDELVSSYLTFSP